MFLEKWLGIIRVAMLIVMTITNVVKMPVALMVDMAMIVLMRW